MVPNWLAKNPRWKLLMQSLYYPAVLGTCFVLLINKLASHTSVAAAFSDITVYFGLLLTLYFTVSYLMNNEIASESYGLAAFAVDLLEIVLVFLAFTALGYLEPQRLDKVNLRASYMCLAPVPVLQQVWNRCVGSSDRRLLWLSGSASILAAGGAVLGGRWLPYDVGALVLFYSLLAWYFWVLVQD